jgi:hypothetical protein
MTATRTQPARGRCSAFVAGIVLAALFAIACAATPAASGSASGTQAPPWAFLGHPARALVLPQWVPAAGGVPGDAGTVGDWRHAWQVVGLLRARPPQGRVVYYFGDSTARESLISEASWNMQLRRLGAHGVRAYALAGHGQTFAMDARIMRALPHSRGLALIGVSLSRFIGPPVRGSAAHPAEFPPGTAPRLSPWRQHLYDSRPIMTRAEKQGRVVHWRRARTPAFFRYRTANLRALVKLIAVCRARGLRPVLVELPLDLAVVRHHLDRQRASLRAGCRAMAARHGVRFLPFQLAPHLPGNGFFDIVHMVRAGYTKWQAGLSRWVIRLLPR